MSPMQWPLPMVGRTLKLCGVHYVIRHWKIEKFEVFSIHKLQSMTMRQCLLGAVWEVDQVLQQSCLLCHLHTVHWPGARSLERETAQCQCQGDLAIMMPSVTIVIVMSVVFVRWDDGPVLQKGTYPYPDCQFVQIDNIAKYVQRLLGWVTFICNFLIFIDSKT